MIRASDRLDRSLSSMRVERSIGLREIDLWNGVVRQMENDEDVISREEIRPVIM